VFINKQRREAFEAVAVHLFGFNRPFQLRQVATGKAGNRTTEQTARQTRSAKYTPHFCVSESLLALAISDLAEMSAFKLSLDISLRYRAL
jgi:hypothetical protein